MKTKKLTKTVLEVQKQVRKLEILIYRNPLTLNQIAKARHWTPAMLKALEKEDKLTGKSKIHKGQRIKVPWGR